MKRDKNQSSLWPIEESQFSDKEKKRLRKAVKKPRKKKGGDKNGGYRNRRRNDAKDNEGSCAPAGRTFGTASTQGEDVAIKPGRHEGSDSSTSIKSGSGENSGTGSKSESGLLEKNLSVPARATDSPALTGTGEAEEPTNESTGAQTSTDDAIPQLGPGVYEKIPHHIYHLQNSFSRHDMLRAAVPAKLHYYKTHPGQDKVTPAKIIGSAFHARLLEPEVFNARYTVSRYEDYRSNEAKNWRDSQTEKGLTIISISDMDTIDMMVQSMRECPNFGDVFNRSGMRRELTVVARDPATGILLRARYDIVPCGNVLPDIKSAMDASPEEFGKAAWNYSYGYQAAHYLYVWNLAHPKNQRTEFLFFVQEKEPPYLCNRFITPYPLIEYCGKILRARRYIIAECMKRNIWPSFETPALSESLFELPRYAIADIQRSMENG